MAHDRLSEYLAAVGGQIRWKRARRPLLRELSDHIADQAGSFRAQGADEEEAMARAVAEMGDPEEVGRELDRLHRPKDRWGVALAVILLAALGIALQSYLFQTAADPMQTYGIRRQTAGALLAIGALAILWFSDYSLLFRRKWGPAVCLLALEGASLLATMLGHGYSYLIYLSLLLPVPYAALLCRLRGRGGSTALLCGAAALLLPIPALLAPSFAAYLVSAGSMLLALTWAVLSGWSGARRRTALLLAWLPSALGALAVIWTLRHSSYGTDCLSIFLHPELDPLGAGWRYLKLRSGQSPVLRPGDSDLLLSDLAQLLGPWVVWAAVALILLAGVLLLRRIRALQSRNGKLIALAALCPLLLQAVLYCAFNVGWSPVGALSLPFLSYGAGYLVVDAVLAGVLLSVFRMDALVRDAAVLVSSHRPLPDTLHIPLGKGTLYIEYRKKA